MHTAPRIRRSEHTSLVALLCTAWTLLLQSRWLALVLVICCVAAMAPSHLQGSQLQATRLPADTTATTEAVLSTPVVTVAPAPQKVLEPSRTQTVTDHRRQIFDSTDVMATVNAIRQNGTGDEKRWAALLVASCSFYAKPFEKHLEDMRGYQASRANADSDELTSQKRQVYEVQLARCEGTNELDKEKRMSLLQELWVGASANPGVIGQLEAIAENVSNGDTRWTPAQADLITDAIYGGDPAVARAAFYALYSSIDGNAPGGSDMRAALLFGMASTYVNAPLSQFERASLCVTDGWCDANEGPKDDRPSYRPAVLRLMSEYRAAFDAHLDARRILAIR